MSKSIQEMDGLPRAYMELNDGFNFVRFVYRVVHYIGTDRQARQKMESVVQEIKDLLPEGGIIIWRQRPELDLQMDGRTCAYMRFATSPPLPEEFWQRHGKLEGRAPKEI